MSRILRPVWRLGALGPHPGHRHPKSQTARGRKSFLNNVLQPHRLKLVLGL